MRILTAFSRKEKLTNIGRIIKQRRITVPLTLQELAARSGVSSSHLARVERGERFPSARVLQKVAKPLGFDESELFANAGFLSPKGEHNLGQLDPYVASVLSQEPVEVQRTVTGMLSILKSIAKVVR